MCAAILVREVWKGGAIVGAAVTPVVVAIVSESLRRPVDRLSTIRNERYDRTRAARSPPPAARRAPAPTAPAAPELERADPFGIWQEDRGAPFWQRLNRRHLKIALATGLAAFAVG